MQGNVLEKKQVDLLQIGMHKDNVILFVGKPILNILFDENKWIYIERIETDGNDGKQNKNAKLLLEFDKNNILINITRENI